MALSMGQIIKDLRKKNGFTQEVLAERLGVTYQAVSKWENDMGMPDISQVVPLARVFGVSTDVLFGIVGTNDLSEVRKILDEAQAYIRYPLTAAVLKLKYDVLVKGLKQYPNNMVLLMQCLETGLALAYPENDELYDSEHGKEIYLECVRQAKLVITYSANSTDVLRAHMIMVLLHSAYGEPEKAWAHAQNFPWRADMTIHLMYAYYAHWQNDFKAEASSCQFGIMHFAEALLNMLVHLYEAYIELKQYKDAAEVLKYALDFIDITVGKEKVMPPLHYRENGDICQLMAKVQLKLGDAEKAIMYLEKMVIYDIDVCEQFNEDMKLKTPLLRDVQYGYYKKYADRYRRCYDKLTDACFDELRGNPEYVALLEKVLNRETQAVSK